MLVILYNCYSPDVSNTDTNIIIPYDKSVYKKYTDFIRSLKQSVYTLFNNEHILFYDISDDLFRNDEDGINNYFNII